MGKKKRQKQSGIARQGVDSEMNPTLAKQTIEVLGKVCSASAIECFDREDDKVRRVVLKINPQVYGQFLVLAIMQSDVRYEGVINQAKRRVDWCMTPNCQCKQFIATASPLEAGFTIDD